MTRPIRTRPTLLMLLFATTLLVGACGGSGEQAAPGTESVPPPPPAASSTTAPPATAEPLGDSAVAGTVTYEGTVPRLRPVSMNADPVCAGKHEGPVPARSLLLGDGQRLGNVFVQVTNPPAGTFAIPAEPVVIDQNGCLYEPHVVGVLAGQTLRFRNSDDILHNVHGLPEKNREFNLGMPGAVKETDTNLPQPEPAFPVKCDVHPWMRAYVAVMSHPFFAVTDASGAFRIEGLPAGTYELQAWHEKLGTQTASVTVADSETSETSFTFAAPAG